VTAGELEGSWRSPRPRIVRARGELALPSTKTSQQRKSRENLGLIVRRSSSQGPDSRNTVRIREQGC
jgi:hypothetical protein